MTTYTNYKHQDEGICIGKEGSHAFFWSCGTGKTKLAIEVIKYWKSKGFAPALVVCPLSIIETAWLDDCNKFAPGLKVVSLWAKSPAERKKRLARTADIYIANFESLRTLYDELVAKHFNVIVVDESSKMKDPTSQTTRALLSFSGLNIKAKNGVSYISDWTIPFRYVLTGTPAPNDETEYWSQIKFITGPGNKVFSDNYYAFRGYFCSSIDVGNNQKIWRFRKPMRNELAELLSRVAHVVRKEDAVDLPEQTHVVRKVYLSDPERKAYDTFEKDLVLQYEDVTILGSSALVEIMKLRQLTSGFAYSPVGTIETGSSKLKELKDLLQEIGPEQVLIWANFRYEISQLLRELPGSQALWNETPDREKVINDFKSGRTRYLIANPQSAAHGLTFVNARYAIYYSLNYSYELHEQSVNRIHRIGQKWPCTYYYLLAADTLDELIYKTVLQKKNVSDSVLSYLRSHNHGKEAVMQKAGI